MISSLSAEIRAVWVTPWDIDTPEKCDQVIQTMKKAHQNQILAEVRYRSDAMYIPNREMCQYPNPDPRCYILKNSSFDALSYLIEKAKLENIEVHAWLTIMVASTIHVNLHSSDHVYYQHPEWFTWGPNGRMHPAEGSMGIFIDPGIPQVQEYIVNVIRDIVVNYPELNGIHLDYIRYPGSKYGKNPTSLAIYHKETEQDTPQAWQNWRREQINHLVERIYAEVKHLSPQMALSAAVIANYSEAYDDYAQDWKQWLDSGYIDRVYLMAYTVNDQTLDRQLLKTQSFNHKDRTVIGLRCWAESGTYPITKILSKLFLVRDYEFAGTALFSYESTNHNRYWNDLIQNFFKDDREKPLLPNTSQHMIFGYVTSQDSLPYAGISVKLMETGVETRTDINGFYAFTNIPGGIFSIEADNESNILRVDSLSVSATVPVKKQDIIIYPMSSISLSKRASLDTLSVILDANLEDNAKSSNKAVELNTNGFFVDTISDSIGVIVIFRNPREQVITWSVMNMDGKVIFSKNNKYLPGEVIESWNGKTADGSEAVAGVYQIVAVSEFDGERISQSVILRRKMN